MGMFAKTNKAKAYQHIIRNDPECEPSQVRTLNIVDGKCIFYQLKNVPDTFEGIAVQIYYQGVGSKSNVVFSTDFYDENSLKSYKRNRR